MRVRDALAGTVVGALVLVGGAALLDGRKGYVHNTTAQMPRPNRPKTTATDGRKMGIVQICFRPGDTVAAVHTIVGPDNDKVAQGVKAPCRDPFQRRGLVREGDSLTVAWIVDGPSKILLGGVSWSIWLEGEMKMHGESDPRSNALYGCRVGLPPC